MDASTIIGGATLTETTPTDTTFVGQSVTMGQIASMATPDKNILDTGSLSYQDLDNRSHWSAEQTGLSLSGNPLQSAWGTAGAALGLMTPQHHDSGSTTHSGVAPGTVIVRDDPNQDLGGLNQRQTYLDGNGVGNSFDPVKIARNQETGQVAAEVGMRAAGDLAGEMYKRAVANGDTEGMKAWGDGGVYKDILHGLVGAGTAALGGGNALQGAAGATASETASGAMQDYLVKQGIKPTDPVFNTLMQLGSAAVGVAASGGATGAGTALAGDTYNRQLHKDADPSKDEKTIIDNVLAPEYAKDHGITVELAAQILEGAAAVMLDQTAATNAVYDPVAMREAESYLRGYAAVQGNPTIGHDTSGQPVPMFGVSAPYQYQDAGLFSDHLQSSPLVPQELGAKQVSDWVNGFGAGTLSALNPTNIVTGIQSTVNMLTDPAGWMAQAQQGMGNVFYQAQQGNFEPVGQVEGSQLGSAISSAVAGAVTGALVSKANAIPKGFSSAEDFARFGADARDGLMQAGYGNVEPILQGSAVTGQSFKTGQVFDVGRVSDFDIALASPELLQRAQSLGIGLRSGGSRTGPLSARDLQALGLKDLAGQLSAQTGREVNFMIYDSAATATSRAPSMVLPK